MTVFEDCSHIYRSNDGALQVERSGDGWIVFRPNGRDTSDVVLSSESRDVCEAFVMGYDCATSR